jgi:hypothetical protein
MPFDLPSSSVTSFFGAIPPMIFFYIRHKVKRIPGGVYMHPALPPFLTIPPQPTLIIASLNGSLFSLIFISTRLRSTISKSSR